MKKNILELFEETVKQFPNKIAFTDTKKEITFSEFQERCQSIASYLITTNSYQKPMVTFLDKSVDCLLGMFGIVYSGNFYTVLDTKMPEDRINLILDNLLPEVIITDESLYEKATKLNTNAKIIKIEDIINTPINKIKIEETRAKSTDLDILYILFTSGSTGTPKGTVITHQAVISYIHWYKTTFDINEKTVFGSQTPFYFSMSVSDIYATLVSGATFHIIPKMYFSFPVKLIEFLNEKEINTIYWVPSALSIVANLKTFDVIKPTTIKKVLFAGEVMPTRQLNTWRKALPTAMFANLFGPTELTDICTYYIIDREFSNEESLPIGKPCSNCEAIIVKENNEEAKIGEEGELLIKSSFSAAGYYNNPEKTKEAFVQNPLNNHYPDTVYRTGDIVKYNEQGELIYLSRKDFQIKHMGYRIELGEIEAAFNALENIISCACIYENEKIILYYQAKDLSNDELVKHAKTKLPPYMMPNEYINIPKMPYNANGKIDRVTLKKQYKEEQ